MNLIVIDCYDSFTYNLVHYLEQMSGSVTCIRNDRVDVDLLYKFDGIVLSPGPGLPDETMNLYSIIEKWGSTKPILGICLGHQAIGSYYGLELINMPMVHHGIDRPTLVIKDDEPLFKGLPTEFLSARYHSWVLGKPKDNSELEVTAIDSDGGVMGVSHRTYNIKGVQFHPESVLTEHGFQILKNWVSLIS
ncbi:MAG: aminodeoxychorismate/anthranilate synthase component II [Bacteroidales bacterium]|nr:MAG: aminodeoxychorismate/anthranilate synthase component II [Bacteroidales bacterium]